jgi:hypothetical protein
VSEERADTERPKTADAKRDPKTGQFGPGNCANPQGYKAGKRTLTSILRDLLEEQVRGVVNDDGSPMTNAQLLVRTAVKHAAQGNPTFFREILERMDGKVPDRIEAKLGGDWTMEYDAVDEAQTTPTDAHGDDDA